ncbi:hypothetical protein ACWCQL_25060 [Streptomyces sp. NPDC002073]
MSDISAATWTTYVHGERTEIPATIDGIRAALPAGRQAAFDAEIGSTPADELRLVLLGWALEATGAGTEDAEIVARLRRGETVGRPVDPETGAA